MTWQQLTNSQHLPYDLRAPGLNWQAVQATIFSENAPEHVAAFFQEGGTAIATPENRYLRHYAGDGRVIADDRDPQTVLIDLRVADLHSSRVYGISISTFEFFEQLNYDCGELLEAFHRRYEMPQQRQAAVMVEFNSPHGMWSDRSEEVAHDWLLSHLEPAQREEWTKNHIITVHKPAGHRYEIHQGHSMNVQLHTEDPQRDGGPWTMCVVSADDRVPPSDQILMQYLMIRYNEKKFVETAMYNGERPMWVDGRPLMVDHSRIPTHMERHNEIFVQMRVDPEELRRIQEAYARDVEQAAFRYQQDVNRYERDRQRDAADGFRYLGNIWQSDIGPIITGS